MSTDSGANKIKYIFPPEVRADFRRILAYGDTPNLRNRLDAFNFGLYPITGSGVGGDVRAKRISARVGNMMRTELNTSNYIQARFYIELFLSSEAPDPKVLVNMFLGRMADGVVLSANLSSMLGGPRSRSYEKLFEPDVFSSMLRILNTVLAIASVSLKGADLEFIYSDFVFMVPILLMVIIGVIDVGTSYLAPPVESDQLQLRLAYLKALSPIFANSEQNDDITKESDRVFRVLRELSKQLIYEANYNFGELLADAKRHPFNENPAIYECKMIDQILFWAYLFKDPFNIILVCARFYPDLINHFLGGDDESSNAFKSLFSDDQLQLINKMLKLGGTSDVEVLTSHHNLVIREYVRRHVEPLCTALIFESIRTNAKPFSLKLSRENNDDNMMHDYAKNLINGKYSPLIAGALSVSGIEIDDKLFNQILATMGKVQAAQSASNGDDILPQKNEATASAWSLFALLIGNIAGIDDNRLDELVESIFKAHNETGGDKGAKINPPPVRKIIELAMSRRPEAIRKYYMHMSDILSKRFGGPITTSPEELAGYGEYILARLDKRLEKTSSAKEDQKSLLKVEWSSFRDLFLESVRTYERVIEAAESRKAEIILQMTRTPQQCSRGHWGSADKSGQPESKHPDYLAVVEVDKVCSQLVSGFKSLSDSLTNFDDIENTDEKLKVSLEVTGGLNNLAGLKIRLNRLIGLIIQSLNDTSSQKVTIVGG